MISRGKTRLDLNVLEPRAAAAAPREEGVDGGSALLLAGVCCYRRQVADNDLARELLAEADRGRVLATDSS